MKYARIENSAVAEIRNMAQNFDPDAVRHKFDFRRFNRQPDPAYDPATEKLGADEYTINADSVDGVRSVVAMTQEEQDAYAQAQADAAEREQVKAVYLALKNGEGTNLERLVRLEKVTARMLKDLYQGGVI